MERAWGLARMGFLMAVDKQTNRRTQTQQHGKNDNNDDDWLSCCRLLSYCVLPTCYLPPPPAASPAGYLAADCSRTVCCLPANCRLPPPPAASPAGYLAADCSPTLYCLPSMLFTIANASPVSGRQAMVAELAASGRRLFVFAFLPLSLLLLRPAPSRQWPFPRRCRIGDAKMPDPRPRSFMPRRHMSDEFPGCLDGRWSAKLAARVVCCRRQWPAGHCSQRPAIYCHRRPFRAGMADAALSLLSQEASASSGQNGQRSCDHLENE